MSAITPNKSVGVVESCCDSSPAPAVRNISKSNSGECQNWLCREAKIVAALVRSLAKQMFEFLEYRLRLLSVPSVVGFISGAVDGFMSFIPGINSFWHGTSSSDVPAVFFMSNHAI